MTTEPIRDPAAEEPRAPDADVPTPDPASSRTDAGAASATAETAIAESSAAEAAVAESSAVDGAAVESGALGAGAVDAGAAEAPPETAVTPVPPFATPETAVAVAKPSRRPVILGVLRRLAILVIAMSLFVVGIGLGQLTFQRTRPAPPVSDVPITVANTPPEVAREFITALGANDADAMRSALAAQPNKDLTDEFERFSIQKIVSVETLGTSVDGDRSATEILLKAEKTDGLPFEVNLVILVDGGAIEGFR